MAGIIEVRDLSKTFETDDGKVEALQNISLSVQAGDIYGIIGMSGAGKSTLVRQSAGSVDGEPASGNQKRHLHDFPAF